MPTQPKPSVRGPGHATGPRTAEGKRRVSRNAVTHGLTCRAVLLPEDNRAQFEQFRQAMIADGQPVGGDEQNAVEQMVAAQWRLARLWRQEAGIYAQSRQRLDDPQADLGVCLLQDLQMEKGFAQLTRQEAALHRQYHRASRRLQELQALRRKGLRHVVEDDVTAEAAPPALVAASVPAQPSASSDTASGKIAKQTSPTAAAALHETGPARPAALPAAIAGHAPAPGAAPRDPHPMGIGEFAERIPVAGTRAAA